MKSKLLLLGGLICLVCSRAFAVNFMGPPTAELAQGQYSLGYNYAYSVQDLDKTSQDWYLIDEDVIINSGEGELRIEDLTVQRHYVGINGGITDQWEIYARIGFADVKSDIHWLGIDSKTGYNFDSDFAWGWGTKYTFAENDTVAWGISLHMNWLDTSASSTGHISGTGSWKDTVDIDTYDTLLAIGPTVDMGGWKLYAGPFYYSLDGDYEFERNFYSTGLIDTEEATLEEDSNFGGFVGAVVDIKEDCDLAAEFSFTSDGWAIGAGVAKKF